jgi:AcrR family transcriptional regulator
MIDVDRPLDTREKIIVAAREVIKHKGKRGATTREIADLAGVNEATIFRHFGNKEALIVAVAKYSCPDVKLRDVIAKLEGPIEKDLFAIGQAMSVHMESMIDMIRWSLVEADYEESIFAKEAWRPQTAIRAVVIEYFERQVKAGTVAGEPDELAGAFMGMIFARTMASAKFPDSRLFQDRDYAIEFFVNVFLNGTRSK